MTVEYSKGGDLGRGFFERQKDLPNATGLSELRISPSGNAGDVFQVGKWAPDSTVFWGGAKELFPQFRNVFIWSPEPEA